MPKAISHAEALIDIELPTPSAESRDMLVKVAVVTVNPVAPDSFADACLP